MQERGSETNSTGPDLIRMMRPLEEADLNLDLITRFFLVFSRFEYALKRAGYVRSNEDGYAEADWAAFGRSVRRLYNRDRSPALSEATEYLLSNPPKRQAVGAARTLVWEDLERREEQTDIGWLLVIVRTVRNNLFHGGKYPMPYGYLQEPARDATLLKHTLTVLEACLGWERNVRNHFTASLHG